MKCTVCGCDYRMLCRRCRDGKHVGCRGLVANSKSAARAHHAKHGDMEGHTCLLRECALHYPRKES